MSKITTFIDTLRLKLAATYPDRIELTNPNSIEDNTRPLKESGMGFSITSTADSEIDWLQTTNVGYICTITLANVLIKKESDSGKYYKNMKVILEDELLLRKLMEAPDQLGIPNSINKISYAGTSGIENVGDGNKYKFINVAFTVDISESI